MTERVLIIGWPGTGKTTLAKELSGRTNRTFRSTDEVMNLGWSESSAEVATWFDQPGPWIIEGVAVARALRKWLKANPDNPLPVDKIMHLHTRHKFLDTKAIAMGKGIDTVLREVMPYLQGKVIIEDVY